MEQGNFNTKNSKREKAKTPRKPRKITESYLHNAGLYYLERFATSSENFRRVMMRKVHKSCYVHTDQDVEKCAAMVDTLVKKFQDLELINDQIYTRSKVNSMRRRGKSRRYILSNLGAKGLDANTIEQELKRYANENHEDASADEFEAAITFARKKKIGHFRIKQPVENQDQKELAALARAGFSYDIAKKALNYSGTLDD